MVRCVMKTALLALIAGLACVGSLNSEALSANLATSQTPETSAPPATTECLKLLIPKDLGLDAALINALAPDLQAIQALGPIEATVLAKLQETADFTYGRIESHFEELSVGIKSVFARWKKTYRPLSVFLEITELKFDEDLQQAFRRIHDDQVLRVRGQRKVDSDIVNRYVHDFRVLLFGLIGETKAIFFFRNRILEKNAHFSTALLGTSRASSLELQGQVKRGRPLEIQAPGQMAIAAKIAMVGNPFFAMERQRVPDVKIEEAFAPYRKKYPTLFNPFKTNVLSWKRALSRLKNLEIDFITVGDELPNALVEVKACGHIIDLADLAPGQRNGFAERLDHSVEQLLEARAIFGLGELAEVVLYFPNGISVSAKAELEGRYSGVKIYAGTDGLPDSDEATATAAANRRHY